MSSRFRRSQSSDPIKYAPGVGARVPPGHRPLGVLEWLALLHAGIFLFWLTWAFGGGSEAMRPKLAWYGILGLLITLTALQDREAWRDGWMRPLIWLWPLLAFNAVVLIGCLNPSFREVRIEGDLVLIPNAVVSWLPSSARPGLALPALWMFNALWIPAFNLVLLVRQRRALRGFLLFALANALALSVFGTAQKLLNSPGIFFGAVKSPQKYFFSTFIYHNHWGAFILLMIAAGLGLVWHHARRHEARNFFHSLAFAGLVALLFLAVTLPLSGSRSSTLLGAGLFGAALIHWLYRFVRDRRRHRESVILPLTGALAALILAAAGIWYVARDTISARATLTREQVAAMVLKGNIGSRSSLYHDTWRMAKDKLWFGWGMTSYPHVFTLYNQQRSVDRLPAFYRDAHSDWLQSFAEHGLVGSALLGLCAVVPLLRLRRRHLSNPLTAYLLAGCAVLLFYAWVEFPFGNLAVVFSWWLACFSAVQYARLHDREAPAPTKAAGFSAPTPSP